MFKQIVAFVCLFVFSLEASPQQIDKVDSAIREFSKKQHQGGIAVSIITPGGKTGYTVNTFSYGHAKGPESAPPNEKSIFFLASVTKVLTATVLAKFVEEGKVRLDDPVQQYVPGIKVPTYQGKPITLQDLANHTSGLPRDVSGNKHPYHYQVDDFYQWLQQIHLKYEPGTKSVYSNAGFGFLGIILSNIAGKSFEDLVVQVVCNPLNMPDTRMYLSNNQKDRLCEFYGKSGQVIDSPRRDTFPGLGGGGAFASTLADMTNFVVYNMGLVDTSLNSLLPILFEPSFKTTKTGFIGLGWEGSRLYPTQSILKYSKNGGLKGVSTFIGFVKETQTGVVVLSNTNSLNTTSLGNEILKILNPEK